jgi:hypothetical protein
MMGMTCHDTPYLSVIQPQGPSLPPSVSLAQRSPTSSWDSQFAWNERVMKATLAMTKIDTVELQRAADHV